MKQQTAIEYLVAEISKLTGLNIQMDEPAVERALEMEKKQIIDAAYFGHLKGWVDCGIENSFGEEYYKETFKSEEK